MRPASQRVRRLVVGLTISLMLGACSSAQDSSAVAPPSELPPDIENILEREDNVPEESPEEVAFVSSLSDAGVLSELVAAAGSETALIGAGTSTCRDVIEGRPAKHAAVFGTATSEETAHIFLAVSITTLCPSADFALDPATPHFDDLIARLLRGQIDQEQFADDAPWMLWLDDTQAIRSKFAPLWDELATMYWEAGHQYDDWCERASRWVGQAKGSLLPTPDDQLDVAMANYLTAFSDLAAECPGDPSLRYEGWRETDHAAVSVLSESPAFVSGLLEFPGRMAFPEFDEPANYVAGGARNAAQVYRDQCVEIHMSAVEDRGGKAWVSGTVRNLDPSHDLALDSFTVLLITPDGRAAPDRVSLASDGEPVVVAPRQTKKWSWWWWQSTGENRWERVEMEASVSYQMHPLSDEVECGDGSVTTRA